MSSAGSNPTPSPAAGPERKTPFFKRGWFIGITSGLVGFIIGAVLFVTPTEVGSDSESSAGSSDSQVVDEPEETEAENLTDEGDSGGLYLKAVEVTRESKVTYIGGTSSSITPDAEPVTVEATDGGYYLYVRTEGRNGTKEPIDLTCSLPLEIAVFDESEAQYTPIEGLDQIEGNPECNEQTQPGQNFEETFIFLMPEDAEPNQLVWTSINSDFESAEPAGIDLTSFTS